MIIGYNCDLFVYYGKTESGEKCTESCAIKQDTPQNKNYKLFFDNWFCSLALCLELIQMGFLTIATIRSDRIKSCPLPCEKDLMKRGRGAHVYRTDLNSGISVLRWYDNKCV